MFWSQYPAKPKSRSSYKSYQSLSTHRLNAQIIAIKSTQNSHFYVLIDIFLILLRSKARIKLELFKNYRWIFCLLVFFEFDLKCKLILYWAYFLAAVSLSLRGWPYNEPWSCLWYPQSGYEDFYVPYFQTMILALIFIFFYGMHLFGVWI